MLQIYVPSRAFEEVLYSKFSIESLFTLLPAIPKSAALKELYIARNNDIGSAIRKAIDSTLKLRQDEL